MEEGSRSNKRNEMGMIWEIVKREKNILETDCRESDGELVNE